MQLLKLIRVNFVMKNAENKYNNKIALRKKIKIMTILIQGKIIIQFYRKQVVQL